MSTSTSSLRVQARIAIKEGQRQKARVLLQQAVRQDPADFVAWVWLAGITPSPEAGLEYIRRAEALRPGDPMVIKARKWIEGRMASEVKTEANQPNLDRKARKATKLDWQTMGVVGALAAIVIALATVVGIVAWDRFGDPESPSGAEDILEISQVSQVRTDPGGPTPQAIQTAVATEAPTRAKATPTPTPRGMLAKNITNVGEDGQAIAPRATWTTTPTPTSTPSPTPTYVPTFVSPQEGSPPLRPLGVASNEKWIDVNLTQQSLTAFEGNDAVFSTLISSGTWEHPTVTGLFRIWVRYTSQTMDGRRLGYDYYLENVPYVMYFYEDYALHGTFWHNNFGTPMSHGCVNLKTSDAEWIFNWSQLGTVVNVHY